MHYHWGMDGDTNAVGSGNLHWHEMRLHERDMPSLITTLHNLGPRYGALMNVKHCIDIIRVLHKRVGYQLPLRLGMAILHILFPFTST